MVINVCGMGIMRKLNNAANAIATSKFRIDTNHTKTFITTYSIEEYNFRFHNKRIMQ